MTLDDLTISTNVHHTMFHFDMKSSRSFGVT